VFSTAVGSNQTYLMLLVLHESQLCEKLLVAPSNLN
jgi:hypothetical protein